jgi:Protein of unknown function (DUF3800)
MSILTHAWGISAAQDRVWVQVSGMSPEKSGRRLLLALQAFIDDSYSADGYFVLGGHIASAEAWAAFAKEWEHMLPFGVLDARNKYHFKMAEMAQSLERMGRVGAFYRIIEHYVLASISCRFKPIDLIRAKNRVWINNCVINYGFLNNNYMFAFRGLLDMFHTNKNVCDGFIPIGEQVDFIFDNQTEKYAILSTWDEYIAKRPDDIRDLFGAHPRFEDDKIFLPLQAADLWAWWVRKWANAGSIAQHLDNPHFDGCTANRRFPRIDISFNEDQIVKSIISLARDYIEPGRIIYDVRFSWMQ